MENQLENLAAAYVEQTGINPKCPTAMHVRSAMAFALKAAIKECEEQLLPEDQSSMANYMNAATRDCIQDIKFLIGEAT